MCLALLPLLGPYTSEQPRRPKGGADDGRDIECLYQGNIPVWGAVGFRNGGGNDSEARRSAEDKFELDLNSALTENPSLAGFLFFTNVDLTIARREKLVQLAQSKNVKIVEIFDMERLRHVLDSPEGLIARLQYLDIPMSPTEQAALVGKFGNQLQNAVTSRFDRVERTLAQMERFLDFQKPLLRLDAYIQLSQPVTSAMIGNEAVLMRVEGLENISKRSAILCVNDFGHAEATNTLVARAYVWGEESASTALSLAASISALSGVMVSYNELSLTVGSQRVRIADMTLLHFEAHCTAGLRDKILRIYVDANGYELISSLADGMGEMPEYKWNETLPYKVADKQWVRLVMPAHRNLLFDPPMRTPRFLPIYRK